MHAHRPGLSALFFLSLGLGLCRAQTLSTPTASLPRGWLKAASLVPGERLRIQVRYAPAPTFCSLAWMDNTALACDAEVPSGTPRRLVFPAAQVYSVARDNAQDCDEHCGTGKRLLIGAGVGGLLGGVLLAQNSGRAGAFGAMLGAGIGGASAAGPAALGARPRSAMSLRVPLRRPAPVRFR